MPGAALFGHVQPGWSSTLATVLILGGANLVVLWILGEYVGRMYEEVKQYTDREVFLKTADKSGLPGMLETAWAVVCPVSVAGVEAAIYGVPVFSTPLCPSSPVNAGELKDIERPEYKERYEWANSLAWASWHWDEVPTIDFKNYQRGA